MPLGMRVRLRALGPAAVVILALGAPGSAAGQTLGERVEQCAACHGAGGNSRIENIPSIAGQPEIFLVTQLILMREGVRRIEAMTPFVKGLKDEEIIAIARHFTRMEALASEEQPDPKLVARGATLAVPGRCTSCHREDLAGQQQMPRLARQRIDYMVQALKSYRDDTRSGADTAMTAVIYGLSDDDLAALAHYAASR